MDVDGVEDNGTARDELVDAEIEGPARFGGLGEFFAPWDLQIRRKVRIRKTKKYSEDIRIIGKRGRARKIAREPLRLNPRGGG